MVVRQNRLDFHRSLGTELMRHYYTGPPTKEAILDWAEQAGRSGQIKAPLKDFGLAILKTGGTMLWVEDHQPGGVPYPRPA